MLFHPPPNKTAFTLRLFREQIGGTMSEQCIVIASVPGRTSKQNNAPFVPRSALSLPRGKGDRNGPERNSVNDTSGGGCRFDPREARGRVTGMGPSVCRAAIYEVGIRIQKDVAMTKSRNVGRGGRRQGSGRKSSEKTLRRREEAKRMIVDCPIRKFMDGGEDKPLGAGPPAKPV
jgi:hypothetical protein